MAKLSVIMPVYNEKINFLKNSIESILNQTYKDFEFIIIDDASQDYIQDVISSYKDSRIKYNRLNENSKVCAAMNYGIYISSGEYIAIMHSDDFSVRSRLEKQTEILDKYPNIGLVNSYTVIHNKNKSLLNMPYLDSNIEKLYLRYIGNNIAHSNVTLRKSILTENNIIYNNRFVYAEDYRMWTDIMPLCDFYTIPEALSIYNVDVNPSRQNKKYMSNCRKVILLENYMKDFNLPQETYNEYIEKIWKNKLLYRNYIAIKRDNYDKILNKIKPQLNHSYFCQFKTFVKNAMNDFKPN